MEYIGYSVIAVIVLMGADGMDIDGGTVTVAYGLPAGYIFTDNGAVARTMMCERGMQQYVSVGKRTDLSAMIKSNRLRFR